MKSKYVKYLTGTMAIAMLLAGCEDSDVTKAEQELDNFDKNVQSTGVLVVVQEVSAGQYKIQDESPSSVTKIIIKHLNGTMEVLNESQAKNLFAQDKQSHPGNYETANSNFPMWWLLYNSNFGYGLGRTTPPSPTFARYYVHPASYQKAQFFAPNIAKGFTGSSKIGISSVTRATISRSASSGFGSKASASVGGRAGGGMSASGGRAGGGASGGM